VAIPDFWLAMLLVVVLAVNLHLLAPLGYRAVQPVPSRGSST